VEEPWPATAVEAELPATPEAGFLLSVLAVAGVWSLPILDCSFLLVVFGLVKVVCVP
jgi:hypothetical protein